MIMAEYKRASENKQYYDEMSRFYKGKTERHTILDFFDFSLFAPRRPKTRFMRKYKVLKYKINKWYNNALKGFEWPCV